MCVYLYSGSGASLHGLVRANHKHLFSAPRSETSCWWLEICHSGIFTLQKLVMLQIRKSSHKSWLLNTNQLTYVIRCVNACACMHPRAFSSECFKPEETKLPCLSILSHVSPSKHRCASVAPCMCAHTHRESSSDTRISEQDETCYSKEKITVFAHVRHEE